MKPMSFDALRAQAVQAVEAAGYTPAEARWVARMLLEDATGLTRTQLVTRGDAEASPGAVGRVMAGAARVAAGEPVQYVLGHEAFMGMRFKVTPAVLIPRPETEQMVEMIDRAESGAKDLRVADLCTGSGCIAVALARVLPFSRVTAVDVSPEALAVARENVAALRASRSVELVEADIRSWQGGDPGTYDIVVSNPPYVLDSERGQMDRRVLDHEPALALFTPDSDPLRYYRAVAAQARRLLRRGGRLYLECNPLTVDALAAELAADGWSSVTVSLDDANRRRFLSAVSV